MRRTKVLLLIKGLGLGGAERLLLSFLQVRDRGHFDYRVAFVLPSKDALVAEVRAADVPVLCLARGDRTVMWPLRLRRMLIADPVDVLHLHSPVVASVARVVVRTLPKSTRPIVVTTEHSTWSSYAMPTRIMNAITFGIDDAQIAVSNRVRQSIPRVWRKHVNVIVHGIILEQVRRCRDERDDVRAEIGVGPGELVVGTVANYTVHKAYPDLLMAARKVIDDGTAVRFLALGQGPLEDEVRALHASLGLGRDFLLLGRRPDAVRVLAGCDMFVLASRREGFPVALMEALGLGLPVVATTVGGVPEAVTSGREGWLVPPARADLLADAIVRLARDDETRKRMAESALAAGERYDMVRSARRIESLYRDLLG
jgi:glycosyltransferase involved in cell wall biosynthesis